MTEQYQQWGFVQMDEQFVAEIGENIDEYDTEELPYLVMDVWEVPEIGTVWEIRRSDEPQADYVPANSSTFHRFHDCLSFYNPRDEVLCYFVLSMQQYYNSHKEENERIL